MRLIVSLLLIPMLLFGPPMPHVHGGSDVELPEAHHQRPHIHVGWGHHHVDADGHHHHGQHSHHHHGDDEQSDDPIDSMTASLSIHFDHDSDAVYLASSDWSVSRSLSTENGESQISAAVACLRPSCCSERRLTAKIWKPDQGPGLPVYLRIASLRL